MHSIEFEIFNSKYLPTTERACSALDELSFTFARLIEWQQPSTIVLANAGYSHQEA